MAHFAQIDEAGLVIQVVVTDNALPDEGLSWLETRLGGNWIKTSYNSTIRGKFAGIGDTYNAELDVFLPPKPFDSWLLDSHLKTWVAPVAMPTDGKAYIWDEATTNWIEEAGA